MARNNYNKAEKIFLESWGTQGNEHNFLKSVKAIESPPVKLVEDDFFPEICLDERKFIVMLLSKYNPNLLKNIKIVYTQLLESFMHVLEKYSNAVFTTYEDRYKVFLGDNVLDKIGFIGTDNPEEKWKYLKGPHSTCREKTTALHAFWESRIGGEALFRFVILADEVDKYRYPFVVQRKLQIHQLFNNDNDEYLLSLMNNTVARRTWSQVSYTFPAIALRRITQGESEGEDRREFVKLIKEAEKTNFAEEERRKLVDKAKIGNPLRQPPSCKYDFSILIEPFSNYEQKLIRTQRAIPDKEPITVENYPFRMGACYDYALIKRQPTNSYETEQLAKCRVAGVSGSCAIIAELCLLFGLDWKSMYLGLLVDYVPIHHGINEILQSLNIMGFINDDHYKNPYKTIIAHAKEVSEKEEEGLSFNYRPYIKGITRGFKISLAEKNFLGGAFSINRSKYLNRTRSKTTHKKRNTRRR